jgi:xanthine dehydrogenase accessory factor
MDDPETLAAFLARHPAIVRVRVAEVRGSAPRDTDAEMLVAPGAIHGTIGGGQLEYMAIDEARALIARSGDTARMDVPLGPEIGQCCGGRVVLELSRLDAAGAERLKAEAAARAAERPMVLIFGAGHVGRALAAALMPLPVRAVLIDSRRAELDLAPAGVESRLAALPEAEVRAAPPGAAFVILTHDHALDFLLSAEALGRGDAAYVGMIGSATKRAAFRAWCRRQGGPSPAGLTCPIGAGGSADKRPAVIAAFVAAEVIGVLTRAPGAAKRSARRADDVQKTSA